MQYTPYYLLATSSLDFPAAMLLFVFVRLKWQKGNPFMLDLVDIKISLYSVWMQRRNNQPAIIVMNGVISHTKKGDFHTIIGKEVIA